MPSIRSYPPLFALARIIFVTSLITASFAIPSPKTTYAGEEPAPVRLGDSLSNQYISAGQEHTCGIKPDDSIECWGNNDSGQLDVPTPNSNFIQVSVGSYHSCGLKGDGSIICWGDNTNGQATEPVPNTNFTQVSTGLDHNCGVKNDGSLVCWGSTSSVPAPNSDFSQVSAGANFSCGLKNDGSLVCWGDNSQGQSTVPPPNENWSQVSAGRNYTCGLKNDGSLVCWGSDAYGKASVPSPNSNFSQVSTGYDHTCARKSDGTAVCWGRNGIGQGNVPTPNSNFSQVSTGALHSCGLKDNGDFICWGNDNLGQGNPNLYIAVSAGAEHTCALTKGRVAKCWGDNINGQISIPSPNNDFYDITAGGTFTCGVKNDQTLVCWGGGGISSIPAPNSDWRGVSAGLSYACASRWTDFALTCWGMWSVPSGTVAGPFLTFSAGINATCGSYAINGWPAECWPASLGTPSPNTDIHQISTGHNQACAIRDWDTIVCWGDNSSGESTVPAPNTNWQSVSVGINHACGLKDNATKNIICWGDNTYGQSTIPLPNANFRRMDAGYSHTCGIKNDGTLLCWGRNAEGQSDVPHLDALKVPPGNLFPPSAEDDSYTTLEDTPITILAASGVLANDHDLDGDSITAHKDSDPGHGTVSLALDGSFTYSPTGNLCGPDSFTYHAEDATLSSNTATVNLSVTCVNDPPSFSAADPPAVNEDAGMQTINNWTSFSPGPANESGQNALAYTVSNISNPSLFSQAPVVNSTGTLTYQSASDQNGSSTFDLQVQDDGGTANGGVDTSSTQTFTITVIPINDQPDFSAADPPAVNEDAGAQTVSGWATFTPGPTNESPQTVQQYIVSSISNPTLFSASPSVSISGDLSYTPAINAYGTSTFDMQVQDDGGTVNGGVDTSPVQQFTITVNPVGDTPTTTGITDVTVLEDATDTVIDLWPSFADVEDSDGQLTYSVEGNTNTGLFTSTNITGSPNQNLVLSYAVDQNGSADINVRATDTSNLWIEAPFTVTVTPVNDPPSFTSGGDVTVPMDSGAYSATWASNISPGPSDESGQALTFQVSNNNNGLFATQPAVTPGGALTFTPASGATGTAQVSIYLMDNGGTANGGIDTSPTDIFLVTVAPFPIVTDVQVTASGAVIPPGGTIIGRINNLTITFDMDVDDPAGDTGMDDVTNPANYMLLQTGPNGVFDTPHCAAGLSGDDVGLGSGAVLYNGTTFSVAVIINNGNILPDGDYRLCVCGTTSITAGGVALGGDGVNSGTDYFLDFSLVVPDSLPETGFAPDVHTTLPAQPVERIFNSYAGLWLQIPSQELMIPIVGVPLREGRWDVTWLANRAGWLEGSAFPTWAGNSVLTGHAINSFGSPGPFSTLDELRYGDEVIIHAWGQQYIYEVRALWQTDQDETLSVMRHEDYPWLTLLTCRGYDPTNDTYLYRTVIRAVQEEIQKSD